MAMVGHHDLILRNHKDHHMDDQTRIELEAAAFRRLRQHLMDDRPE